MNELMQAFKNMENSPTFKGMVKQSQLALSSARGKLMDVESTVFDSSPESLSSARSLKFTAENLEGSEYVNRRIMLLSGAHSEPEIKSILLWAIQQPVFNETVDMDYGFGKQISKIADGQVFLFGDTPNYGFDLSEFTGSVKLPYDRCVFVLPKFNGGCFIALVERLRDDQILISGFYRSRSSKSEWTYSDFKKRIHLTNGRITEHWVGGDKKQPAKGVSKILDKATRAILAFVDGLDKKKAIAVKPTLVAPVAGKTIAVDGYTTVYMCGVIPKANPPLGGSHASPREHERRGHWATIRGKKVFRKAATVNKNKGGILAKEYLIKH